jgi:hypothetical protein
LKFAAILVLGAGLALPALAAPDDGFAAFWKIFAAAAAKDDAAVLARLTVLGPGLDQEDKTFAGFHAHVLTAKARRCLAVARPKGQPNGVADMEYAAFCGQLIFGFSKTPAGWKLTDISPDD